jgi:hypothetical protein
MFGLETENFYALCEILRFLANVKIADVRGQSLAKYIDEKHAFILVLFYFSVQNLSEKLLEKVLFNKMGT